MWNTHTHTCVNAEWMSSRERALHKNSCAWKKKTKRRRMEMGEIEDTFYATAKTMAMSTSMLSSSPFSSVSIIHHYYYWKHFCFGTGTSLGKIFSFFFFRFFVIMAFQCDDATRICLTENLESLYIVFSFRTKYGHKVWIDAMICDAPTPNSAYTQTKVWEADSVDVTSVYLCVFQISISNFYFSETATWNEIYTLVI